MNQLPEGRRTQILDELRTRGMLRITQLADLLGVAPITVRRDITQLAAEGIVRRVHGGAVLADDHPAAQAAPASDVVIGMVVPSLDYYWPEIIQGAQDEARDRGIRLLLRGSSYDSADDAEQVSHLLGSGATGMVLAPDVSAESTMKLLTGLRDDDVPAVLVEREVALADTHEPVESVTTDHVAGAAAAVRHLAALGHERIALVSSSGSPHADDIRRGWLDALAAEGLAGDVVEIKLHKTVGFNFEPAPADVVAQCRDNGATAVLVHADREAIAIVQACQQQGLRVPEDLSVVAYDDEVAALSSPALTAVRPPRHSIGRAAVSLLAERISEPRRPTHRVVISPRLSLRDSVTDV